jgi:putative transposase
MRRSKSIETLLPVLYLKGISTGDFSEALAALLGKDASGEATERSSEYSRI